MVKPLPYPMDVDAFARAYSEAWTRDPEMLVTFFSSDGTYTDVAMGTTYRGHHEILRFHRWMLKFAPDSVIEFAAPAAHDGNLYLQWLWSGSFGGPLKLRNGQIISATGTEFAIPGVAVCRYDADGKLAQHRDFWEVADLLEHLDHH
jgi:steroid delta-isomerase-like uncharacterized protein